MAGAGYGNLPWRQIVQQGYDEAERNQRHAFDKGFFLKNKYPVLPSRMFSFLYVRDSSVLGSRLTNPVLAKKKVPYVGLYSF